MGAIALLNYFFYNNGKLGQIGEKCWRWLVTFLKRPGAQSVNLHVFNCARKLVKTISCFGIAHIVFHTIQWRIQSWSQGGFPKVANLSGW